MDFKEAKGWGQISIFSVVRMLVSFHTDHAPSLEHCASAASLLPEPPCLVYS